MRYFDYEKIAREAQVPPEKLDELSRLIRQDFPKDDMMYELHLLRACMAIKEGAVSVDETFQPQPAFRTERQ